MRFMFRKSSASSCEVRFWSFLTVIGVALMTRLCWRQLGHTAPRSSAFDVRKVFLQVDHSYGSLYWVHVTEIRGVEDRVSRGGVRRYR